MKKINKKYLVAGIVSLLLLAGVAYTQTSSTDIEGFLRFRSQSPQIRVPGTLSIMNSAGTQSGALSAVQNAIVTTGTTVTRTLLASECGSVVIDNGSSSTQTYTLPAVANAGCQFTFIAGDAGGEILINASTTITCVITTFGAVGTDADTTIVSDSSCQTGLKNTAATNAIGDNLTLVSDGTRWLGVGITGGIWAAQ